MNTTISDDPLLPTDHGVNFVSANTKGDGACGLHALLGDVSSDGQLVLQNARHVAGALLDRPLTAVRDSTEDCAELRNIIAEWWSDFIIPVLSPAGEYT
eukprot:2004516-Karenia_brevis.AAC.1